VTPIIIRRPEIQMSGAGDHVMETFRPQSRMRSRRNGVRTREVPMTRSVYVRRWRRKAKARSREWSGKTEHGRGPATGPAIK